MNKSNDQSLLFRNLNALGALAVSVVLYMALYDQFFNHDLPCPLCLLQRVGFVAVLCGLVLNIARGPSSLHYSMMTIAALYGAATALRQVSLHVIPGSGSYGDPFFGMHYYTWSFVLFTLIILGTAIVSAFRAQYQKSRFIRFNDLPALCKIAIMATLLAVAINVVATFAECGPGACPDDPKSYWLFG